MPEIDNLNVEAWAKAHANTGQDSSESWQKELHIGSTSLRQAVSEGVSSLGASTSGAVAYSLMSASGYGRALSIPVAIAAGSLTKVGVKAGLEDVLLDQKDRTLNSSDLLWGGVDGLAGIAASAADERYSKYAMRRLSSSELGRNMSLESAEMSARQLIGGNVWEGLKFNTARGIVGGAAGTLAWSLPHQTYQHWNQLGSDPMSALTGIAKGTAIDTLIGSATGGAIGGTFTAIGRSNEIIGRTVAKIQGSAGKVSMDEYAINDFHSNIDALPRLKTKLDELMAGSRTRGTYAEFNTAGDDLSGHSNFAFTNGGEVETRGLASMGVKNKIPGNHEYDAPGGRFVPERYPTVIGPVLHDYTGINLLNANLDFSSVPNYPSLVKPYVVEEIHGPNGPVKVGTIGLTTEEGAVGGIHYNDAAQTAVEQIRDLNAQGVTHIKLLTHLGLEEDKKLAQTILDNGLHVAKITGGHSHDIVASPIWIGTTRNLFDRLQFWKSNPEIPITQAGSSGRFLSENHIVFNADGSADRWRTTGKLHPMQDVVPEPTMKDYVDNASAEIKELKATDYDSTSIGSYSLRNTRNRETALGNLLADSNLHGVRVRLAKQGIEGPDVAMVHSGGIRSDIPAGVPLTRQELANVVMNAGKSEGEKKELVMLNMSGAEIRRGLEFGLKDFPTAEPISLSQRLSSLFEGGAKTPFDEPGNFVQVSGLKYSYDLTKPPGERVSDVFRKQPDGSFSPLMYTDQVKVLTRFHAVDKWSKAGVFDHAAGPDEALANGQARPITESQVEMLGDFIRGRTLNPQVDSAVEGRIQNLTPISGDLPLRPRLSLSGQAITSAYEGDSSERR